MEFKRYSKRLRKRINFLNIIYKGSPALWNEAEAQLMEFFDISEQEAQTMLRYWHYLHSSSRSFFLQ